MVLWGGQVWYRYGGEIVEVPFWTVHFKYQMRHLCGDAGLTVGYKPRLGFRGYITRLQVKSWSYHRDGILKDWNGASLTSE